MAHVFLVAFEVDVEGGDRDAAQDYLIGALASLRVGREDNIESWWVAEDDRRDGSDNASARFIR